jgi:peptide-methionine (R)-S-oxide reductase
MKRILNLSVAGAALLSAGCGSSPAPAQSRVALATGPAAATNQAMNSQIIKSDEEWKKELTPDQYRVLREKGTERAFTGEYWNTKARGVYRCAGCGAELFVSDTKFDSGCGWPSFFAPKDATVVAEAEDNSHFMKRTEVLCSKCGGHLGHVFNDGPNPTGLRYCINSAALKFNAAKGAETNGPASR